MKNRESSLLIRYLHAGKSPKEIAFMMCKTHWAVLKTIERNAEARAAYIETYHKRYPHRPDVPNRVVKLFVQ